MPQMIPYECRQCILSSAGVVAQAGQVQVQDSGEVQVSVLCPFSWWWEVSQRDSSPVLGFLCFYWWGVSERPECQVVEVMV